jgi:hypothetical protein
VTPTGKNISDFEAAHGGPRIKHLEHDLEVERAKVAMLADVQNVVHVEESKDNYIRFGLTGDRHTGSLCHHAGAVTGLYEHFQREGIDQVFDTGDILDGHKMYKGHEFELLDHGLDAQLERVRGSKVTLNTRFITGNHDGSFKSAAGIPVGKLIELMNPGVYQFLGEEQARHRWETPNGPFELMLLHPGGGTAYAISYKPQKIVESLEGGTKPDMLAIGHFHKAEHIPSYRNVAVIQTGTLQRQTPFMARNGLAAHVGGWIVEVWVGGDHNRIRAEFIAIYS